MDYLRVGVAMLNPCIDQIDAEGFELGSELGALLLGSSPEGLKGQTESCERSVRGHRNLK